MAVDRLLHRAVSTALLLVALIARAAFSWRNRTRHLLERLNPTPPLRHLAHPPARWAAA